MDIMTQKVIMFCHGNSAKLCGGKNRLAGVKMYETVFQGLLLNLLHRL